MESPIDGPQCFEDLHILWPVRAFPAHRALAIINDRIPRSGN